MRAEISHKPLDEIPELVTSRKLAEYIQTHDPAALSNIQIVRDHFTEVGPNGTHLCLVYQVAGPSISSMLDCPGRVIGSRRLRGDLARKVAKQAVFSVELMHAAGFIHGDLTTSNILFHVAENFKNQSDRDAYLSLGEPETERVIATNGNPPGPHVPAQLIAPIHNLRWENSSLLQENTLLIDFGQSFSSLHPPKDYQAGTVIHYQSPEARFVGKINVQTDIWGLACTIFEIRAGFPLFEVFLGGSDEVLKEIVSTLGKLPEPWWGQFERHHLWFDEDGEPKAEELQQGPLTAEKTTIKQKLASIGDEDEPETEDGLMMERPGTKLDTAEIELLGDLLEKMLRYKPQDRITMSEIISHPWFSLE